MSRKISFFALFFLSFSLNATSVDLQKGTFTLPPLTYPYNGLEPSIDERTMHLHHDHHHQTYVDNLNKAVKDTAWDAKTLPELFLEASHLPAAVRNNAGGHWNHSFYWEVMTDDKAKRVMPERLKNALIKAFGSIDAFKEEFRKASLQRFGSGYAWLIQTKEGTLQITSTANQDNPLMNDVLLKGTPLLLCDVWEHAYYLKYTYLRADYFNAFWDVINWQYVNSLLQD